MADDKSTGRRRTAAWTLCALLVFAAGVCFAGDGGLNLRGTYWDKVAQSNHIDPYLLYSIALVESRVYRGRGATSPWPWVINTPGGPLYSNNRKEAERNLALALARWPTKRVDIGLMQICAGYHRDKVSQISDLLDPEFNLRTAAQVLVEALLSAPNDVVLAIGRYHSSNTLLARRYGRKVLDVYARIAPRHLASATP